MAMKFFGVAVLFVVSLGASPLQAQTAITEVDATVGHSTEHIQAVASQARVFGEAVAGWRYYLEATWADVWGPESDVFTSAYPYDGRIRPMEVYAENTVQPGRYLVGARVGRYRTPFGIYSRSDHAYNGFLRAPLIRYGDYWALSNNFLEGGASVIAGMPKLLAEMSLGKPQDEDSQARRDGLDRVVRVQGSLGPFIIGASHIRTLPSQALAFARGHTVFSGLDVRWMWDGVQLRGEWIDGRPFDGAKTFGGYVDAIVHRPEMGPVTAVLRAEQLDYVAGLFSRNPRRYTAGARIRLSSMLAGQINLMRQPDDKGQAGKLALDFALTFTTRH